MRGPKPAVLALNELEQRALEELVRRHSTPQQIARRARMILAAAQGKNNARIGRELGVKADTVRGREDALDWFAGSVAGRSFGE